MNIQFHLVLPLAVRCSLCILLYCHKVVILAYFFDIQFYPVEQESQVKQAVKKPDANVDHKKVKDLKVGDPENNDKANQKDDNRSEDEEVESDQDSDEDDEVFS